MKKNSEGYSKTTKDVDRVSMTLSNDGFHKISNKIWHGDYTDKFRNPKAGKKEARTAAKDKFQKRLKKGGYTEGSKLKVFENDETEKNAKIVQQIESLYKIFRDESISRISYLFWT